MAKKSNNMIELIAKLNEKASLKQIKDDIKTISKLINADKDFNFQIKCSLDQKSLNTIKSQLAGVFNNLKISPTTGISAATNSSKSTADSLFPDIGVSSKNTDTMLRNVKDELNDYLSGTGDKVTRVTKAYEDATGALQRFYVQVEQSDKSIATLTYAINKQGDAFKYLGETIREADNSTDFRRKDISTQWTIQGENLKKFISNAEKAGVASTVLKNDIEVLQQMLNSKVKDTNSMSAFLDRFDIAKSKLQAFNAEIRKSNATDNFNNRLKKLTADMLAYASANERATTSNKKMSDGSTTFAGQWNRMKALANSATLTDQQLKQLATDMTVFRREAQAAGLAGESAFSKFLNSFKMMSSYVTANMVFNFVRRQVRNLVNEVIELDTAMVELRKVTVATDEDFEKFGSTAADIAKEYGASITDVVNATSTFARLGESLKDATELGRVAILYQNVGDGITEEQASEDLVAVMKAYKIEAKDAITIVDKLNEVGNNYAITSGGIGEALKRSASAMSAANNSLSETIALITTANTIAQDPQSVGNGLKTMSLRLRSTKTELEDMGEDAEGAAESVSKLRAQMLALTGVDIQLDDTTYKSSYQILLEISKVWDRLDDISQASVLEQLFGKRQANIGAAILENGRLLERVYETSEGAAGSAAREQEEYAKSIQFALDALKASYQEFAQAFIGSDFIKSVLNTAQSFLEVLTAIVKTFGSLPPIIATISTIMGVKGHGIFPTEGITSFSQALESVKVNFQTLLKQGSIKELYRANAINLQGLSKEDILSLQNYVNLLNTGEKDLDKLSQTMSNATAAAKAQTTGFNNLRLSLEAGTISEEEYKAATQSLAASQRAAAISSKALSIALNAIGNIAIMAIITLITKGISALADKLIITKEELAEVREAAIQDLDAIANAMDDLVKKKEDIQDLVDKYKNLIRSTTDISEKKEELIKIQDSLSDKLSDENGKLDLLNDTYDETIKKIKELSDAQYDQWKKENADKIIRAEKIAGYDINWNPADGEEVGVGAYNQMDELAFSLYTIEDVSENIKDLWQDIDGIEFVDGVFSNRLYLSGDIHEAQEELDQLIEAINNSDLPDFLKEEALTPIVKQYNEISSAVQDVDTYLEQKSLREAEYVQNIGEVSTKTLWLLKQEMGATADEQEKNIDELRAKWFKALEETGKTTLDTINKMKSALQTINDGDLLSSEDFWNLKELDTEDILTDVQLIGNQFKVNEEQLVQFKDAYIAKQVKSLDIENEKIQTQIQELNLTIEQAKVEAAALANRGLSNDEYRKQYNDSLVLISNSEKKVGELERQWRQNKLRVQEYNASLGNTISLTEALSKYQQQLNDEIDALNAEIDARLQAQEYVIDGIINGFENELSVLEDEKQALQNELDILNDKKSLIEDTIKNYDSVNKLVQDTVQKEIDSLNEQKQLIEDTYNARINALKAENEEREDALEYAQKLANLENAKNNKVRVIDSTRGFRYESIKEDVVSAQNDLASYENNQAIKQLEKERDAETKAIDNIIKEKQDYANEWKDISDIIKTAEDELLAEEILGYNWRELIASGDIEILQKFKEEYINHNTELQKITKSEIKLKQAAIDAKDAEIKSKKEQIEVWKNYKTQVQDAVKTARNEQSGYLEYLGTVQINEKSNLDARYTNLQNFTNNISGLFDTIGQKQTIVDNITSSINALQGKNVNVDVSVTGMDLLEKAKEIIDGYSDRVIRVLNAEEIFTIMHENNFSSISDVVKYLQGLSEGGVTDYTGLVKMHGRKNAPEVTFNTNDAKKLYGLVHNSPNLIADSMREATKIAGFKLNSNSINSNSNRTTVFNIDKIVTDSPQDFARQMESYFRNKLTEGYTNKQ